MTRSSHLWAFFALFAFVIAAPAYAAGGGEKSAMTFVWEVVNFAMLVGAIVYFARKPIVQFFADRRSEIGGELESAATVLEEAEARFGEWQQKMARIEDCQDCGSCRDRCPYDLDPPALLAKMHEDYKQFAAEHAEAP